ncbi:hypothetical protein HBI56_198660 [Parastagonospora nodorum]|nr:hypothetical protein HBH53_201810 [Parastagonospora nodorum]KAH3992849.1 hypothetical protein HBI10_210320 [Parastagonospora nodorum]KAH4010677.1 hypothetical protein HBI13_205890 [Parastagonospora nodorum]KAH4060015.1 hypothetical protein HBH50_225680 [Parastagonospora nodorum]KAH4077513.1 hypothetical protein HBH48_240840 [Parastagonospora nodorum]
MLLYIWLGLVTLIKLGESQFSLYPAFVDPVKLSKAYGVTTECIQGLNQTLAECDPDLFGMVVNYDMFWWEQDNITDLCLGNCSVAAALWYNDVVSVCKGQWLNSYGKWIPADSVAGRYVDGIKTACLYSNSLGDDTAWCLVESQEWVGSDVYQVDCDANPSDPSCTGGGTGIDPSSQRMANLYSNNVLCNDCFVQMLYTKVTSEFLADTDHADYLVGQLQDIADVCNTSIPAITTRATISWDSAPAPTPNSATTTPPPATTTCAAGQGQTLSSGTGCDALSQKYGISTGDLEAISGSDVCSISTASCFPLACSLQQIGTGATCDTMANSLNITTVQFQSWNPNIIGLCDGLQAGQYVCKSAPGVTGTYTLAPPPLGTDADAGNQQRGGSGGVVTPTTTIPPGPTTPVAAPGPTLSGVSKICNAWQTPGQGLGCVDFALLNGLGSEKLYEWNPILGPNGENCTTMFQFKVYYCVGVVIGSSGSGQTTPPSSPTITSVVGAPGPTQSGIISSCNKYALPANLQGCYDFASANGITPTQLYSWNAVLGSNGETCGSAFQAGEYYCVGIQTPSSTKPVSAPGPTQSGIVASCTKFAKPPAGTGCYDFATQNGITPTQLYQWNKILGQNGENCGTEFFGEDYYCIAA